MRVLICYRINEYSTKMAGVFKKFVGQVEGFSAQGLQVYGLFMSRNRQRLVVFKDGLFKDVRLWQPIAIEGEQQRFWHNALSALACCRPDAIYVRYDQMYQDACLVPFFERAHSLGVKTILELPTYPYAQEIKDELKRATDASNRCKLADHVDHIFSTCKLDTIMGTGNSYFTNQIDQSVFDAASNAITPLFEQQPIRFLSVANVREWHGFDRLIRGMGKYVSQPSARPVHYDIVGEGAELQRLQQLVKEQNLTEQVSFHGHQSAEQLSSFYDKTSLCIGSMGLHRIGITHSSTLKVREYLANGLPVVACNPDPALENLPWVCWFDEDDSALDVEKIVCFADSLNRQADIRQQIRDYARQNLSWANLGASVSDCLHGLLSDQTQGKQEHRELAN